MFIFVSVKISSNLFAILTHQSCPGKRIIKIVRNRDIRDASGVFFTSSLLKILMLSFFTWFFAEIVSLLCKKKKIRQWLEDMKFIFSR